jgi:hypothetical protein
MSIPLGPGARRDISQALPAFHGAPLSEGETGMSVPQPPYGPPPYQPWRQPGQQRRSHGLRNGCLIAAGVLGGGSILIVVILVLIGLAAGTGSSTPPAGGNTPPFVIRTAPAHAARPELGRVVYDGDFAFTVTHISCGAAAARAVSAGGIGETVPAGARECIFTIRVTDDKGTAQTFFDSNQYAYDAGGRQFSADSKGGIYLHGDQDFTQVNPGITIVARVPFQIPAGDRIVRLVLHDSAYSGGVSVGV